MKNNFKYVCRLFAALALMASCEAVDLTELHSSSSSQGSKSANAQTLNVNATSTEGTISYPVTVYAFASDGKYVASQAITSASSSLSLKLDPGSYRIVALAGTDDVTIESVETLGSEITVPSQSATALQMGSANVTVTSTPVNAYINMGYMVSGVRFTLSNVPEDATDVSVTVSNVANSMDFSGAPAGNTTVTVPLKESIEYRTWTSSETFVMPSTATSTVLTISITRPDNTETYSYTHASALATGTPYHFRGAYIESSGGGNGGESKINLSGDFIAATWNDTQIVDFNFGNQVLPKVVESGYIPPYSIWNGHAVALVKEIDEHTEELLLFSLKEWTDVGGYKNSTNPNMADSIANSYVEGEYDEWRIMTIEEVDAIREMYIGEGKPSLSLLLESVHDIEGNVGAPIVYSDNKDDPTKGDNVTYLCNDAKNSYSYSPNYGIKISTSSAYKKLYRLRLVKTVIHEY